MFSVIYLISYKPNIDPDQIIIKLLIKIVDVIASVGNACIVGLPSRLRIMQTIGPAIYVQ